jgi:hypothetical protein
MTWDQIKAKNPNATTFSRPGFVLVATENRARSVEPFSHGPRTMHLHYRSQVTTTDPVRGSQQIHAPYANKNKIRPSTPPRISEKKRLRHPLNY